MGLIVHDRWVETCQQGARLGLVLQSRGQRDAQLALVYLRLGKFEAVVYQVPVFECLETILARQAVDGVYDDGPGMLGISLVGQFPE